MGLFERILVPVDGSRYALDAVRLAAKLARLHGSELRLLHVIDESLLDQLSRFSEKNREAILEELRNNGKMFLDDMRSEVAREGAAVAELVMREGIPHEIILEEASIEATDLIVMGKLGRRGVSHILLGSVTERVLEFSDVPVLVVK